ncbi:High mobility group protein C [Bienertia sinuspersici]
MAEDLDDGEFWLPSHFLTDDDILMDFDFSATKPEQVPGQGMGMDGFSSNSDLELTSGCTETESDEEDLLLAGLTREMTRSKLNDSSPSCPVHSKVSFLLFLPHNYEAVKLIWDGVVELAAIDAVWVRVQPGFEPGKPEWASVAAEKRGERQLDAGSAEQGCRRGREVEDDEDREDYYYWNRILRL